MVLKVLRVASGREFSAQPCELGLLLLFGRIVIIPWEKAVLHFFGQRVLSGPHPHMLNYCKGARDCKRSKI